MKIVEKIINYFNLITLSFNKHNYFFKRVYINNTHEFNNLNLELKRIFDNIFLDNNLNFDHDSLINHEIKKSFVKANLNYNNYSKVAAMNTATNFAKHYNIKTKNIYYTNCYSILHLPNDKIEEGNYHIDQDGNNFIYTIWTPITDYKYNALSYFKYGYLVFKLLNKFSIKNFSKYFESIKVKKYNSVIWSGFFLHKGNLNISSDYSSASVIWISIGKKKKSDISFNLSESIKSYKSNKFLNEVYSSDINREFKDLLEIIDLIFHFNKNQEKIEINYFFKTIRQTNLLKKLIDDKNTKYSFFFSILAQRMQTIKNRGISINIKKMKSLILYYDIFSVLCGLQSYSSFMRIINSEFLSNTDRDKIKLNFVNSKIFKDSKDLNNFIKNGYQK